MQELIEKPVRGADAFAGTTDAHVMSQAAFLMQLGCTLRDDDRILEYQSRPITRGRGLQLHAPQSMDEFPVPDVRWEGKKVRRENVKRALRDRHFSPDAFRKDPLESYSSLARNLIREPTAGIAAELFEACLSHPHVLTRVAAARAYHAVSAEPWTMAHVVASSLNHPDPLVVEVAATALARIAPEHPKLQGSYFGSPSPSNMSSNTTSLLVHGTGAQYFSWWQPGGDFFSYVKNRIRANLYDQADRYEWSGGYTDSARATAAKDLIGWIQAHNVSRPDVIMAHSHGANVCNLATQSAMAVGILVLLSCPVWPGKYMPDFTQVNRVASIRVQMDLIILADGGGNSFAGIGQIDETVLPFWFTHSDTHAPKVWAARNLDRLV